MKKIIIFLLFSQLIFSQEHNFKIVNYQVLWEKIYEVPETSKDELLKKIQTHFITSMKMDNLQIIADKLSFTINDDSVNLHKLNRKPMTTPVICQLEYDYLVIIDLKDNKYKVTLKEIQIDDHKNNGMLSSTFENAFTKKNVSTFRTGTGAKDALSLFQSHFVDKFSINNIDTEKSDW